jgi:hypothetical protein
MSDLPGSKRPLMMRMVRWGVVMLCLWNLGRAATLWAQWHWAAELSPSPRPEYRLVIAAIWATLFLVSAFGFWRWSWLRGLIPVFVALYFAYELGLLFVFAQTSPEPISVLLYLSFICFSGWVLWRPSSVPSYRPQQKEDPRSRTL